MSFVASPPIPGSGDPDAIANDGWFPNLSLKGLIEAARIEPALTPERVRRAAAVAISSVNGELAAWKGLRVAEGRTSLALVPADQIAGESRLVGLYRRAVEAFTAADLADTFRGVGSTRAGHERADDLEDACDLQRRQGRWAISDILGIARTTCELI